MPEIQHGTGEEAHADSVRGRRYSGGSRIAFRLLFVFFHPFIICQLWLARTTLGVPDEWVPQLYILVALSFILSAAFFVSKNPRVRIAISVMKVLLQLLFDFVLGNAWTIKSTWLLMFVLETSTSPSLSVCVAFTSYSLLMTIGSQVPFYSWDPASALRSLVDLTTSAAPAVVATALVNAFSYSSESNRANRRSIARLGKVTTQLIDANIGFQSYAVDSANKSVNLERKKIARDIHDSTVHSLINIIMLSTSARVLVGRDSKKVRGMLKEVVSQAKKGVQETRRALQELRDIEEKPPRGLRAIGRLTKAFSRVTGTTVKVGYGNLPLEFGPEVDEAVYRMIQEGLSNAFQHGKASKIDISLWIRGVDEDAELIVSIFDNGQGAKEIKRGIGLLGMEERFRKLDGTVETYTMEGGFCLIATVPMPGGGKSEGQQED